MTRNRCCIKNCSFKSTNESENQRQLFKFPSDEEARRMWLESIGENLKERSNRKNFFICNVHFTENSFYSNPLKIFKDGCEVELPRKVLRLKEGSIPSIFKGDCQNSRKVLADISENSREKSNCFKENEINLSKNKRSEKRDLSPSSSRRVINLNQIMSLPPPEILHKSVPPSETNENEKDSSLKTEVKYTINTLINDWNSRDVSQFPEYWGIHSTATGILFSYVGDIETMVTRSICVKEDMTVEIAVHSHPAKFRVLDKVSSLEELRVAMIKIVSLSICERAWKGLCKNGFYIPKTFSSSKKCKDCQVITKREKWKEQRIARRLVIKSKKTKNNFRKMKERLNRTTKKIESMQEHIEDLMAKCSAIDENALSERIKNLSKKQQEVVQTILNSSKVKDKQGMRYTRQWILDCILLSIKSRKAYLHIRNHEIMPLPALLTLRKYLKNLKPRYGFDPELFSTLKKKSNAMKPEETRGVLVIDEMQISKSVSFDSDNLSVLGFTDLGEHTPENQKKQQADHALVFLFQPFRGKWIQNVAAFLSKGAANGEVLSHLVTECIILLENHGFHVDVVTTDGAQWNRGMWKHFGLKNLDASCRHVSSVDETDSSENRRLWFCSDFSHLLKNFRNFMMAKDEILTPDGWFKKKHFKSILKCDGGAKCLGLKIAHKITEDHLDPKFYQKMHVHKAFDLFSSNVIVAMNVYKKFDKDLADCDSTIKVITRVSRLIEAMTSRSSEHSLSPDSNSYEAITDFVNYLRTWKRTNYEANNSPFMSNSTYVGFEVTLRTTLEVMKFLIEECKFSFLMTARLNQDALEGMFGMIRGCCGSYDKPDPLLFIQIYRLLSFYSLVKPPKGSNVDSLEIFETLLSAKDSKNESKEEWKQVLDQIIERGENNEQNYGVRHAHDYNVFGVNEFVLAYFSGFVARKIGKWISCSQCMLTVTKPSANLPRDEMISSLSRGYLIYPSNKLFDLLFALERAILQTVGEEQLNFYTFQHIVHNILAEPITFVGCEEHKESLTKTVINYYCLTRTQIICKKHNAIYNDARKEEKKYRKLSKLVGCSRTEKENKYTNEKENKQNSGKGRKRKCEMPDNSNMSKKPKKVPILKEQNPKKVQLVKGAKTVLKTVGQQKVLTNKEQKPKNAQVVKRGIKVLSNILVPHNVLQIQKQRQEKVIVVKGTKKELLTVR